MQRFALHVGADLAAATEAGHAMRRALVPGATDVIDVPRIVEVGGAVLDAVKLADDRSGDLVVRFHEAVGARAAATVRCAVPVSAFAATDLLERADDGEWIGVAGDGHEVVVALRPHELRTLRLRRA